MATFETFFLFHYVTTTTESLDRGMGMGREVDELATARPGPVGRRKAVRRPPHPLAGDAPRTPRRQSRTHASSTHLTPRNRRHRRLDAGQRASRCELAIGPGVQVGGAGTDRRRGVLTAGGG